MKRFFLGLLATIALCLFGNVEAMAQSVPTFSQLESAAYGNRAALSKCGMKKLRANTYEFCDEEVGSYFYGKNARVDSEGRITPTADHAIVVELCQGGETTSLSFYFSNNKDYQTFISRNKSYGDWQLDDKGKKGKMYFLDFGERRDW